MRAPHITDMLSIHGIDAMRRIRTAPVPRQEYNPGLVGKLLRLGFVEIVELPSPYAKNKGTPMQHLRALK